MGAAGVDNYADLMELREGSIIQELGWDEDADSSISEAIEDALGQPLLDEDADELCDVILLWFRPDDGDLVDSLVDAGRNLSDGGRIWLLTPSATAPNAVNPGEISESAQLAGFVQTKANRFGDWQGACLTSANIKK